MNKKAIPLLIILIISLSCMSFVFADNNTTDNATTGEIGDLMDYIIPISITDNGIEFSDGFTGFCLDLSKDAIDVEDKFTSDSTHNDEVENNVKIAIIECYKSGHEENIGDMVSQAINGDKKYDVVNITFNSGKIDDDTITVNIDNSTEATFEFELLKSTNDGKSDCLAYKVSMKKIANDGVLGASNDETNDTLETAGENNDTLAAGEDNNASDDENNTLAAGEDNNASDDENGSTETDGSDQTTVNETNKTIINKNNTVIVNENNTTIINQKNIKVINKTNETPKNATLQNQIMRTVGNPIFLLAVVIVIIAAVAVVMRRKN